MNLKTLPPAPGICIIFLTILCLSLNAAPQEHVYKKVGDRSLKLHVYKPSDWKAGDKRPAIMFIHGGGWTAGGFKAFAEQAEYFAERGLVAINIEYRLLPKGSKDLPLVCMHDAKSAMRWVLAHAKELGIDTARVAAGGGSAGGHLASFVAMTPGYDDPKDDLSIKIAVAALLLWNPAVGWDIDKTGLDLANRRFGDKGKVFLESSAANNIRKGAPPTLILSGSNDKVVPPVMLTKFQEKMKSVGTRCDVIFYEGQGHAFFHKNKASGRYYYETLYAADDFLASLGWLAGRKIETKNDK